MLYCCSYVVLLFLCCANVPILYSCSYAVLLCLCYTVDPMLKQSFDLYCCPYVNTISCTVVPGEPGLQDDLSSREDLRPTVHPVAESHEVPGVRARAEGRR